MIWTRAVGRSEEKLNYICQRVKSSLFGQKVVKAAIGCKVGRGQGLEGAMNWTRAVGQIRRKAEGKCRAITHQNAGQDPSEPIRTHQNEGQEPNRTHQNPSEPIRLQGKNPSEPIRLQGKNPSEQNESCLRVNAGQEPHQSQSFLLYETSRSCIQKPVVHVFKLSHRCIQNQSS